MWGFARRSPWWARAVLGAALAVLGAVMALHPFRSLSVLVVVVAVGAFAMAVAELGSPPVPDGGRLRAVRGVVWLATGIAVVAWPDVTTRGLAVAVGLSLVVGGLLDAVAGLRGTNDERLASVIGGAASVVFGVLALSWPSVTLLVVAVVFGFRLMLFGLRSLWSAVRWRRRDEPPVPRTRGAVRRFTHLLVTVAALIAALGLAGVGAKLNQGEPVVDAFYDTPSNLPTGSGVLLRSESFTRTIPDDARAWRILYTTTRADGVSAVASALVVVPNSTSGAPFPVIALAHGTTGVDRTCAPSILADPFAAGAFFALDDVIARGWALVATDYVGLGTDGGHPYLVGEPEGRSVLDSVLAARQLDGVDLADQTVVWGHSQGGGAALWTGGLAPSYAPDAGVIGVAALAPASDLVGLANNLGDVTGGSIFASFLLQGYANAYDDVRVGDYVTSVARTSFDEVVGRCLAEPSVLLSAIGSVTLGDEVFSRDLASGPLLARLQENTPMLPIEVPLLVAQGDADSLVIPQVQEAYVTARCDDGQAIDFRTYPDLDHVPLVEAGSPLLPELFDWTQDRFDQRPASPTCGG